MRSAAWSLSRMRETWFWTVLSDRSTARAIWAVQSSAPATSLPPPTGTPATSTKSPSTTESSPPPNPSPLPRRPWKLTNTPHRRPTTRSIDQGARRPAKIMFESAAASMRSMARLSHVYRTAIARRLGQRSPEVHAAEQFRGRRGLAQRPVVRRAHPAVAGQVARRGAMHAGRRVLSAQIPGLRSGWTRPPEVTTVSL
jgi:hypothetical protein